MNGYGYLIVGIVVVAIIALLATNKKFVETLKNIYKIEELRKRILYTLGLLLVYRLGCFVVIPGINPNALGEGSALASQLEGNGLLGLLNVFSGGAFGNAAIFALGVMPYITASIIIQLMGIMIPYFQKMQKEGESGRRKMNQWTRMLTIIVLLIQGPAYITNLYHQVPEAFVYGNTFLFLAYATVILIAGTMFIMWLGEKITDKGIGNGISLIIMIGIVARLPHALLAEINARFQTSDGSAIMLILELVLLFLVFMATVALVQAVRKIPRSVCEAYCRKQTVRRCTPVHPPEDECCERDAYHLRTGADVYSDVVRQCCARFCCGILRHARLLVQPYARHPGSRLYLFLHGDYYQSSNDG